MKKIPVLMLLMMTGCFLSCSRYHSEPNYHIPAISDMMTAVPYEAFTENPNFKDGKTLQEPVAGTIARGQMPYAYGKTVEDGVRAGQELKNPLEVTPEVVAAGKELFSVFCMACHGAEGAGDGPLIPRFPNPPDFKSERLRTSPEGYFFHVITRGKGNMPSHAGQIAVEDRWKIVHYIREELLK